MTEPVIQQNYTRSPVTSLLLHHTLNINKTTVVLGFFSVGLYSGLKSSDPVCALYCFSSNIDPFMASPPQMKATRILSVALPEIEEETEGNG